MNDKKNPELNWLPGGGRRVFIVAEMSANHGNDFELALRTIEAISASGADAVKVQTYTADSLSLDLDDKIFGPKKDGPWKGWRPYDLYHKAAMPYDWQPGLKTAAENLGLTFFSTPFDLEGVDFLAAMDVPFFKIASFEINDLPLIEHAARKGRPMILSTGVADREDIQAAVDVCRGAGNDRIALLKCTSEYPAPVEMANLLTIPDMKNRFGTAVGVSDHSMGSTIPVAAVALGARIVEKHFILDRGAGGPDASFSMEPDEFRDMVRAVREAESALGEVRYDVADKDKLRRRSLFVVRDIKAGEILTKDNIRSLRPGYGLEPKCAEHVMGKRAKTDLPKGTPLDWTHFA